MRHFKSIEDIKKATVEELLEVPELNRNVAEEICRFFEKTESSNFT